MEHRENAVLQRSAMSIENGGHTFRTPAECYVSEITYRSAGAKKVSVLSVVRWFNNVSREPISYINSRLKKCPNYSQFKKLDFNIYIA